MRILKVWDGEYPWDVRAEKVSRALTDAGHEVDMVARNRDGRVLVEALEECTVHRLAPWRLLGRRLDAASQFPAFFNPRWFSLILRTARRSAPDLVFVRDLPLAPTAVTAARILGVPVVLDMAENYPAMIRDLWTTNATRIGDSLVRNPTAVEAVERWTLERVDHVLVVVEESGERLQTELGVPRERITIVGNTPPLGRLEEIRSKVRPTQGGEMGSVDPSLRLVYLGLMEEARGVGTAIEAVALLRRSGIRVTLTLIGDGRARPAFEGKARALGVSDEVEFLGFVPYPDALRLLPEHDVGLIPHFANESWNTTIPNKLFDYMAAGLAVVASDARPTLRVLLDSQAGAGHRSGDAHDLASVLHKYADNPQEREMAGIQGRNAVEERYHWERDAARLMRVLEVVDTS